MSLYFSLTGDEFKHTKGDACLFWYGLSTYPNILKILGISSVGFDSSAVVFWVSAFIYL